MLLEKAEEFGGSALGGAMGEVENWDFGLVFGFGFGVGGGGGRGGE